MPHFGNILSYKILNPTTYFGDEIFGVDFIFALQKKFKTVRVLKVRIILKNRLSSPVLRSRIFAWVS